MGAMMAEMTEARLAQKYTAEDYRREWAAADAEARSKRESLPKKAQAATVDTLERRAAMLAQAIDALTHIETLKGELTAVDVALGNRSAFDSLTGRAAKINAACARAGQADRAESERDRLKAQVETLKGENERLNKQITDAPVDAAIAQADRLRGRGHWR